MVTKARRGFRLVGSGSFPWTVGSIAAGEEKTLAVNVSGAKPGDAVVVTAEAPASGLIYSGSVTSAATVTLRVVNATENAATGAATRMSVLVLRP